MKKIQNALWQLLDWFLYIGMVVMVLMVFINVVGRYVFNYSFASVEEIARILFVWLVYLGCVAATKEGTHIRVDIVLMFLPPKARIAVEAIANLLMDAIMILTIRVMMNLVMENITYPMPITKIPYGIVQGIIPLSLLFMLILNIINLVNLFRKKPAEEGGENA
ncbi:TRAP transporter small permease [uncultured Oscillibacter sp.]|uniref:TRAP transporter small permease n=1 Tax=uncultured Oscillibacter sp. TaxID=876091 RepID=UPI0025F8F796|nr:TRAP transporter small permease [uncultured Oscillibacter sp.]